MRIHSEAPSDAAEAPGVVVIMHGPGLDRFIEDRVADLARHGYAGAGHAFLNFTNAERYRPGPAEDAWQKMLAFLDRHLATRRTPR